MSHLFQLGSFKLHSDTWSSWKIDCDSLTKDDLDTIAIMMVELLPPFGSVEAVPRGGCRLAQALERYVMNGLVLIVDDVLTTGASMEIQRNGRNAMGAVIFARAPCPLWVMPLFRLFPYKWHAI